MTGLLSAACFAALASPVLGGSLHWRGGAEWLSEPEVTLAFGVNDPAQRGTLLKGLIPGAVFPYRLVDRPDGFTYTGTRLTYTASLNDEHQALALSWYAMRRLTQTAPDTWRNGADLSLIATNMVGLDGSVDIITARNISWQFGEGGPSGISVYSAIAIDDHVSVLAEGVSATYQASNESIWYPDEAEDDTLRQRFRLVFVPHKAGQVIQFDFPSSVDSQTQPLPEPGTLGLTAAVLLFVAGLRSRR